VSVVLEPPLTRSGTWRPDDCPPDEPLITAPRFMRSSYPRHGNLGRWHRTRNGIRIGRTGHVVYHTWCGQNMFASRSLTAEQPAAGELTCGTCEGRAIGAGQDTWPVPGAPDLVFEPRRLTRPRKCPGSRSEYLYQRAGMCVLRCLACGELVPGRSGGSPYNPRFGPVNHEPGPGLVPGCPFHAWSSLTVHEGRAVCGCKVPRSPAGAA